ncbi:hypothetical protein JHJ32_01135 [Parapedobacter sp. ISTM3]|uniref:Universal stress protein family protein n=1 Tax=Parapedobacter luteus TaxID=623280 RepID=A0A1T4ZSN5_9SPHI|nr:MULTISPECIES: hypothetical protein [Parapedobacter]MBK1438578.1 hypothetical protein [Parapedobacter sp. ISTM3]SKB25771.1 hypothetical protein SAMN05660226_00026 [Parapedobacter luteus]
MEKNVLIPTDFTIESLNVVKSVLNDRPYECRYNIILLHGVQMSDSITDLLFYSKAKMLESLSNRHFDEACGVIRNKYASGINSMRVDLFNGSSQAAFDGYLLGNRIDEIYVPGRYRLRTSNKKSVNVLPYIRKCGKPVISVDWNMEVVLPEKGSLAEIFYNEATA